MQKLANLVRRWVGHPSQKMELENKRLLLNLLEVNNKARVLDVGCDDGSFTTMIAAKVQSSHVFGMDIAEESNRIACKVINLVAADANRPFPFEDGAFDIVVANQLIEHLYDTDNFVKEAYRILRGGGICICSTMNLASLTSIISLILGYQPPPATVSNEVIVGNPFNPIRGEVASRPFIGIRHLRIFTAPALKELFEFHGFKCEMLTGYGIYPFPTIFTRLYKSPRHSDYITIKARKRA